MKTYGNVGVGGVYGRQEIPLPHAEARPRSHRPWCVDCKRTLDAEQLDDNARCDRCAAAAITRAVLSANRAERERLATEQRKAAERTARNSRAKPAPAPKRPRKTAVRRTDPPARVGAPPGPRPLIGMQALLTAYREGATVPVLAKQYGTTAARVRRLLDHHGVPRRDDRATHSGGRNKVKHPPDIVDQVRTLYHEAELSRTQVGERLGLSLKQVELIMNRHGIRARQRQAGRVDGSKALKQQMRDLGATSAQIKAWALEQGLLDDATKPGLPSGRIVDAYAAERG